MREREGARVDVSEIEIRGLDLVLDEVDRVLHGGGDRGRRGDGYGSVPRQRRARVEVVWPFAREAIGRAGERALV